MVNGLEVKYVKYSNLTKIHYKLNVFSTKNAVSNKHHTGYKTNNRDCTFIHFRQTSIMRGHVKLISCLALPLHMRKN